MQCSVVSNSHHAVITSPGLIYLITGSLDLFYIFIYLLIYLFIIILAVSGLS